MNVTSPLPLAAHPSAPLLPGIRAWDLSNPLVIPVGIQAEETQSPSLPVLPTHATVSHPQGHPQGHLQGLIIPHSLSDAIILYFLLK